MRFFTVGAVLLFSVAVYGCSSETSETQPAPTGRSYESVVALRSAAEQAQLDCDEARDLQDVQQMQNHPGDDFPAIVCDSTNILLGSALPASGLCGFAEAVIDERVSFGNYTSMNGPRVTLRNAQSSVETEVAQAEAAQVIVGENWFITPLADSAIANGPYETFPSTVDVDGLATALGGAVTTVGQVCDLPTDLASYPEAFDTASR